MVSWFFEGDGSLMKTTRGDLMFVMTQSTTDIQILEKIRETLGFSSINAQGPQPIAFFYYIFLSFIIVVYRNIGTKG
jgi:hypothetical protein